MDTFKTKEEYLEQHYVIMWASYMHQTIIPDGFFLLFQLRISKTFRFYVDLFQLEFIAKFELS